MFIPATIGVPIFFAIMRCDINHTSMMIMLVTHIQPNTTNASPMSFTSILPFLLRTKNDTHSFIPTKNVIIDNATTSHAICCWSFIVLGL